MLLLSDKLSAVTQATDGTWQLQLSIPAALAPLTLAYVVHVPNSGNGAARGISQSVAPRTGGHFCVPVGMRPGLPDPLGEQLIRQLELCTDHVRGDLMLICRSSCEDVSSSVLTVSDTS